MDQSSKNGLQLDKCVTVRRILKGHLEKWVTVKKLSQLGNCVTEKCVTRRKMAKIRLQKWFTGGKMGHT